MESIHWKFQVISPTAFQMIFEKLWAREPAKQNVVPFKGHFHTNSTDSMVFLIYSYWKIEKKFFLIFVK